MKLRHNQPFARFWLASTVSDFGTYITTVALSVLILVTLDGTALDQGWVNASRWAPYLLFGLLAGIWVDRFRRRKVLIAADLGRGVVLVVVAVFGILGILSIPALIILMFCFGTLALLGDAAYQSFLPQLVPRPLLVRANARLQQSMTVAQTTGGAVAGGLVALLTAPFALLIDALSYFISGLALISLKRTSTDTPPVRNNDSLRRKVGEGLRWVYGHERLGPMAWSSHIWFIGSAIMGAVFPALILNELRLGALGLGLTLGCAGIGAVLGTLISNRVGERWGTGVVLVTSNLCQPVMVALTALSSAAASTSSGESLTGDAYGSPTEWPAALWAAFILAAGGQLLFGFAMGIGSPLEMGYRQAVTPDRLIARMSATMRSINRGMIVLGAPLGGVIAAVAGVGTALWAAAGVMLVAGLLLLLSKFRTARVEDDQLTDEEATAGGGRPPSG
ncbi:MFS transporter [Arthrobacter sp. H14]|uniref:MFS transporter n=1 Tax=Arthrobacter sp. H14 TaxID=1312959 RepID=UPI0004B8749A|nr:MFS transporter [Arthrobacter sp. H14]